MNCPGKWFMTYVKKANQSPVCITFVFVTKQKLKLYAHVYRDVHLIKSGRIQTGCKQMWGTFTSDIIQKSLIEIKDDFLPI